LQLTFAGKTQGHLRCGYGRANAVISDSAAIIAVIASQVPTEVMDSREFQVALAESKNPPVNFVITNNRNGENFGLFFRALFEMMRTGVSMPMAWVQLAPQPPRCRGTTSPAPSA
jgi:hypothetical protein